MSLQVLVRDHDGTFMGELDVVTEVDTLQRFNNVGSWSLKCPPSDMADALTERGRGVSIRRNGRTLLSGPWWQLDEKRTTSKDVVISGYSDAIYLWDRLVYPCEPSETAGVIFSAAPADKREGVTESVMQEFVLANNRVVDGVPSLSVQPDQLRGGDVVETARFAILGDLLASTAIHGGGIGFDVIDLMFTVYEPVDRRAEAVFSVASGNLQEFTYKHTAPKLTHIIVAGKGEGADRLFVIKGDDELAERWGRRIEGFRDRRDTDDLVELEQTADEELQKNGELSELAFEPIDVPNRVYGVNYGLGDRATGEGHEGVISDVRITVNDEGEIVKPTLGASTSSDTEKLLRRYDEAIRKTRRRVESIERGL